MISFTRQASIAFDIKRRLTQGLDARLDLLTHSSTAGYTILANVRGGWLFTSGGIGEPGTLQIAEGADITQSVLTSDRLVAFGINGNVWKIERDQFKAPATGFNRTWVFKIAPTGTGDTYL